MIPERYTIKSAISAIRNPNKLIEESNYIHYQLAVYIDSLFYKQISPKGEDFIEKDWDNLLLLDACRFDWFQELNTTNGTLQERISNGSESYEFMKQNFFDRDLHDTVYVSANPHAEKIPNKTFHNQINLLDTHWDPEYKTVLPEDMIKETIRIHKKYPNKRLISHFMQPHFPFIGEEGRDLDHKGIEQPANESQQSEVGNPWNQLNRSNRISHKKTINAYYENHEIAINAASNLADELSGKTVISSDHANLVGERIWPVPKRVYGHPSGLRKRELITVPWLEIEGIDRREVTADPPESRETIQDGIIEDRLQHLGYK